LRGFMVVKLLELLVINVIIPHIFICKYAVTIMVILHDK